MATQHQIILLVLTNTLRVSACLSLGETWDTISLNLINVTKIVSRFYYEFIKREGAVQQPSG